MRDFVTIPLLLLPITTASVAAALYKQQTITSDKKLNDVVASAIIICGYFGVPGLIAEFQVKERKDRLRNVLTVMVCYF